MTFCSEETHELTAALAKAQGAFGKIEKDSTADAGSYKYAYAPLATVLAAVRKPLADNGLALVQPIVPAEDGLEVVTRLMHSSGQWIESRFPFTAAGKWQEIGSAITYIRRYAVSSLLGVASEEDDDAQSAPAAKPARSKETGEKASKPQLDKIDIECKKKQIGAEFRDVLIAWKWPDAKYATLTKRQAHDFIDFVVKSSQEQVDELSLKIFGEPENPDEPEDAPFGEPLEAPA